MPTHVYVVSGSKLDTPQLVGGLHSSAGRGWASKATVQTDLAQGSPVVGGTVMTNVAAIVNNSSTTTMGGKLHSRVQQEKAIRQLQGASKLGAGPGLRALL